MTHRFRLLALLFVWLAPLLASAAPLDQAGEVDPAQGHPEQRVGGIDRGFDNSLSMLGEDILYVQKWPWGHVEDWWNYSNRPNVAPDEAERCSSRVPSTRANTASPSTLVLVDAALW